MEVCDEQEERPDKNNEVYCKNYTAIAKIYTKQNNEIKIDTLGITTEENNGQFKAYEYSNGGLHFPLLNFLNSFSKYLGLTSEANMIIYYNENLNCLILSSVHISDIEYLIQLPEKYAKVDEIMFFFNEQSKILTVCDWKGLRITRFMVKSNLKDLHNLNKIYSYNQAQRIRCDKRFTSLEKAFYKVLFGTELEEIANIKINNRECDSWKERENSCESQDEFIQRMLYNISF